MRRPRAEVLLVAACAAAYLPAALQCGLYSDDFGFLSRVGHNASWGDVGRYFFTFSPGRNLVVPVTTSLVALAERSLPLLHAAGVAFHAVNSLLLHRLVLQCAGSPPLALGASLYFALAANHGETLYWMTQFQQCAPALGLILAAFLAAGDVGSPLRARMARAWALYALALFCYDQVAFLWVPLLAYLYARADPRPGLRTTGVLGAALLATQTGQGLYRYFSSSAIGGTPILTVPHLLEGVFLSVKAQAKAHIPYPGAGLPFEWVLVGGTFAAGLLAARWLMPRLERRDVDAGSGRMLAALGGAWALLTYFYLWLWYVSPRHNYIPSAGMAVLWAGAAAAVSNRFPAAWRPLRILVAVLLSASAAANSLESLQWVASARLHAAYLEQTRRWPEPVDNAFSIGLPKSIGRAPALALPLDSTTAVAVDRSLTIDDGDVDVIPAREGAFYHANPEIYGNDRFLWIPYGDMNAVGPGPACLRALLIAPPDGTILRRPLRPAPCDSELALPMTSGLMWAEAVRSRGSAPAVGRAGSLVLELAHARVVGNRILLTLEWRTDGTSDEALAVLPELEGPSAVLPAKGRRWVLTNDVLPPQRRRPGSATREVYALEAAAPPAPGLYRLRLGLYSFRPRTAAVLVGSLTVPLQLRVDAESVP